VRGQAILGEEDFADRFVDHLRKHKEVPEITRSQKYLKRPALEKLFPEDILRNKRKRDRRIADAVERHGYLQREIADHLGLNYATISRLVAAQEQISKYKM
jgi:putative transposase